jgi:D-alanyl-D-alanine carboxypeptidase/D-alanyl-D-alanine-endopeptidase (penicillin-binding protein 4)
MFKPNQRILGQKRAISLVLVGALLLIPAASVYAFFGFFGDDDRYNDRYDDDRYDRNKRKSRNNKYDRYDDRYYDDYDSRRYRKHKQKKQLTPEQQQQLQQQQQNQANPQNPAGGPNAQQNVTPPLMGNTATGTPAPGAPGVPAANTGVVMPAQRLYVAGPLSQKIETLIQQQIPNTHVGIILQEAKSGRILYERNSNETFLPASTTKLFTGAASLFVMGSDYKYETAIKFDPKLRHHETLDGDLYIQFKGDPSLTTQDLQALIHSLKEAGIKTIKGDVIIDNQYFQGPHYATGWVWNSMNWYFSPPITSIILNENKIKLQITSGKAPGEKAVIALDKDESTAINILQDILSVTEEEAENDCSLSIKLDERNDAAFSGCWPIKDKPESLKIAVQNPAALAKQVITDALSAEKISLSGNVILGFAQDNFKTVVSHQSEPLSVLLKTMMQESNNIYAESFTKTMGMLVFNKGNFQSGVRAIQESLGKETKINFKDMRLRDGSGLSRYNLVKPRQISNLLASMYKNQAVNAIFLESFPISGESGTLKERFKSDLLKGKIMAKTGGMLGVSALAGYIKPAKGEDRIFCIMIDDALTDPAKLKKFENDLCEVLLSN